MLSSSSSSSSFGTGDHRPIDGVRARLEDGFREENEVTPLPTVMPLRGLAQIPRCSATEDVPDDPRLLVRAALADVARLLFMSLYDALLSGDEKGLAKRPRAAAEVEGVRFKPKPELCELDLRCSVLARILRS
jgi:hypothetical protein